MKGKISLKTVIVFVILILVIVLGVLGVNTVRTYLGGATGEMGPKEGSVMAVSSEDGKSATISWTSDKESMGLVEYGTTPASLLLTTVETSATTNHQVTLTQLRGGYTYYYRIKVGEDIFENNGIPYSFKMKTVEAEATPIPTLIPTLVPTIATSCDKTTDYNKDGVVNTLDYMECTKTATSSGTKTSCSTPTDYDGNGVINSLDRIKCLQNSR